jgi:protein-S-isoprenylcysteine O-methyltransferase Ste14
MKNVSLIVFVLDSAILYLLIFGAIFSVAYPNRRVWPPPKKLSWQYKLTWVCFYLVFLLNALLIIFDWNSGFMVDISRLVIGIPVTLVGALLVTWGFSTLGSRNTSGLQDKFVNTGPYRFTRNPQYLGDIIMFVGLSIVANSSYLWITHGLLILVFLITPFTEEVWLEDQYGDEYQNYKNNTSRFL